ncbi:DUF6037 family protein [Ralstonia sp. CHL-2022]|uniref:DUF6037 family protein n=1 Tax=Ralstonia mojiangensis TaxID=2953895 RepID=UPI0021B17E70|nr:DUF6037 family protein [Ralstonia mojiangensis]MCT7295579.1 DUF6037 family protein [Ralstonia mojiangensis]
MITIEGLRLLHKSMRTLGMDRYRFRHKHGRAEFDVMFFTDSAPYLLLFGVRGHALAFDFEVHRGYQVDPTLPNDKYKALCRVLGLSFDPNNPFSVKAFLSDFDARLPTEASTDGRVKPEDLAPYRRDVDEAHKIYFMGWRNHKGHETDVTDKNLTKTRTLLGERYYEMCKARRISSVWTDDSSKAIAVYPPS